MPSSTRTLFPPVPNQHFPRPPLRHAGKFPSHAGQRRMLRCLAVLQQYILTSRLQIFSPPLGILYATPDTKRNPHLSTTTRPPCMHRLDLFSLLDLSALNWFFLILRIPRGNVTITRDLRPLPRVTAFEAYLDVFIMSMDPPGEVGDVDCLLIVAPLEPLWMS